MKDVGWAHMTCFRVLEREERQELCVHMANDSAG